MNIELLNKPIGIPKSLQAQLDALRAAHTEDSKVLAYFPQGVPEQLQDAQADGVRFTCVERCSHFVVWDTCQEAPPIPEEVTELAKRWAAERAIASFEVEATDAEVDLVRKHGPMWPRDVERLFAWVRETMPRMYGRSCSRKGYSLGVLLDIPDEGDALRRAARWPS